ncbi:hypothetical protein [Halomarina oriensis]|uniref:Uncharacterized protein n=1 Tax=Halomarina oriensis TaxID=671145 RepID=A0A6B0GDL1_9EURY|nr:hypothetical protein [Halomarina oriensis]MWG32892.1 hypothetical protein [Halomarina oriensis]
MNGTTFGPTTRSGFDRLAFALVAFVALFVAGWLVAAALAAGVGSLLAGVLSLAVGVAVLSAMPFAFVRAMSVVPVE